MKQFILISLSIALLLLSLPGWAADNSKKIPAFDDVLALKSASSTQLSPDGKYVLFTIRECDWEENKYISQVWLLNVETKEKRQMTFSKEGSSNPAWKPGSHYFGFLSARDKDNITQVYEMYALGGEAHPLTKSKTNVNSFAWSPDGLSIAYTANDEPNKHDKAIEKKYGQFIEFEEKYDQNYLWLHDIKTEKAEKIVDRKDLNISSFSWSPDSKQIAFSATPDPRAESYIKSDIYIFHRSEQDKEKKIQHLVKNTGPDNNPIWSADGKFIAFSSNLGSEAYYENSHIAIIPATGGDIIDMTAELDEDADMIDWKGDYIWFSAFQGMNYHIFRTNTKTRKIEQFSLTNGITGFDASLSHKGDFLAYGNFDSHHFSELFFTSTKKWNPIQLTTFANQVKDWTLSTKEAIQWKSTDGTPITGVLIKPADFNPTKKYPLLVIIHGGPASISVPSYYDSMNSYYPIEQWAAKGAIILEPNYRGSSGFGVNFRKLNVRNLGVGDYQDVISGVDYLISLGYIDESRLGAMGWSQGGYISAFITTFSDRFKAVSVGAGISDWVTYYVNTDIPPFTRIYLKATPWDDMEIYKKTSPITYINSAKTPTLIQHGENDRRVPIPNAYKLYRGLKDKNIPVKFVIYKGFGHGINKPKEKRAVLKHNFEWFNLYIWNEKPTEEKFEDETTDPNQEKKQEKEKLLP